MFIFPRIFRAIDVWQANKKLSLSSAQVHFAATRVNINEEKEKKKETNGKCFIR